MINRVTRILTRWLTTHPVYGMSPLLAAVSFDSSAEQAALEIKSVQLPLTIYNDVDDDSVAERYDPDAVPALILVAQLNANATVKAGRGQIEVDGIDVSFAYMERDQPTRYARQRGGYVLTAVVDALNAFNEPRLSKVAIPEELTAPFASTSATWRSLGDVEIVDLKKLIENRVTGGVGTSRLIGTQIGTFLVRRTTPRYIA